jgi:hypothetical protein
MLFALSLCLFSAGCGSGGNQVMEDPRTADEIATDEAAYDEEMEEEDPGE